MATETPRRFDPGDDLDLAGEVVRAHRRIYRYVRQTPVEPSPYLSRQGGGEVFLKLENLQHTGSFKYRGALNKLLSTSPESRRRGIVTASSGNHALAVCRALGETGARGTIFLPQDASRAKVEALELLGANLVFCSGDSLQAEHEARARSRKEGEEYVSPYNDLAVIAGQGTLALELVSQVQDLDAVLLTVGGGGLASGVAGYLKAVRPQVRVVGCLPRHSPVMYESIRAGRIVDLPTRSTLSDGSAGGIEEGSVTFELCRRLVDHFLLVDEEEIAGAMRLMMDKHRLIVEGAAGVAVASYLKYHRRFQGQRVALVICGGNVALATLKTLLCGEF